MQRSPPIETPGFLLDESLPHLIADVLQQVGYPITSCRQCQMEGLKDDEPIPWMAANQLTWITKDDAARLDHGALIRQSLISVVWVRGLERRNRTTARNNVTVKDLHRMLTVKLDDISSELRSARGPRYFRLYIGSRGPAMERYTDWDQIGNRRRASRATGGSNG